MWQQAFCHWSQSQTQITPSQQAHRIKFASVYILQSGKNSCNHQEDTFPKAPWPERWVPPPLTRGIRATALPVPQDSALVWWPKTHITHNLYCVHNTLIKRLLYAKYIYALTCQFTDCIRLAVVLAHVGVHKIHHIRANRGLEHCRHDNIFAWGFSFLGIHRDEGSGTSLRKK